MTSGMKWIWGAREVVACIAIAGVAAGAIVLGLVGIAAVGFVVLVIAGIGFAIEGQSRQ